MIIESGRLYIEESICGTRYVADYVIVNGAPNYTYLSFCVDDLNEFFNVEDALGKRLVISDTGPGEPVVFDIDSIQEAVTTYTFLVIQDLIKDGVIDTETEYYMRLEV